MKFKIENDGVDHINVYSKGQTEIGKLLSNFSHFPFNCEDGHFESIEGYWYWLSTKDDRLRKLYGFQAKQLGRELRGEDWCSEEWFIEKIKKAIKIKFKAMKHLLIKLDLPITHYYCYGDKQVFPKEDWITEFMQKEILEIQNEKN